MRISARTTLHLLDSNEDLTPDEYVRARALIDEVQLLHRGAAQFVAAAGLDREVFLPGNIWADLHARAMSHNWTYDLVNYSRAVSPFSGFHMLLWGREDLPGDLDPAQTAAFYHDLFSSSIKGPAIAARMEALGIPRKIERTRRNLLRFYRARDNLAARYDALVARIPARFRVRVPARGGEIGLVHRGSILNPDVLVYQGRMNALYASGTLEVMDRVIAEHGKARYLEIGPGHCFFAHALQQVFEGRLDVFLVDLPFVMANGVAYIACTAGARSIGIANEEEWPAPKPFTFIPNHLLPRYAARLPQIDLVHNALSLNEMSAKQVAYYLDFIERHLAPHGVFHLAGGTKRLDYHEDALGAAHARLRLLKSYTRKVEGVSVMEAPNTFFAARGSL